MKRIDNLKDLFIEQGRELYDASRQEQKELPTIRQQARDPELRKIIDRQLKVAKEQSRHLETAFKTLNASPEGVRNACCESLMDRAQHLANISTNNDVRDAAIINSVQRINHHKITGYGSLSEYANELGHESIANSLHEALEEERLIDEQLSELAQSGINRKAELAEA